MASFQSQYGIRLSRDLDSMSWAEFSALLSGISPDTPLGAIVSIRSEDDQETLKNFTADQKRIRSEWRNKQAKAVKKETLDEFLQQMQTYFAQF